MFFKIIICCLLVSFGTQNGITLRVRVQFLVQCRTSIFVSACKISQGLFSDLKSLFKLTATPGLRWVVSINKTLKILAKSKTCIEQYFPLVCVVTNSVNV